MMMRSQMCVEEKKRERAVQEEDVEEGEEEEEAAFITTDLYTEILSWLPADDLLTFKRVCKAWLQLISSPRFIQKHLERSKSLRNGALMLTANKNDIEIKYLSNNILSKRVLPWSDVDLLGSSDGLVLCWLNDHKIAAVNPSTGKSVIGIPNDEFAKNDINGLHQDFLIICTWFGRHPCSGEYVLVLARMSVPEPYGLIFEVYSLSRKINVLICSSIEKLSHLNFYMGLHKIETRLLHGRLHLVSLFIPDHISYSETGVSEAVIIAYDFQRNKVTRMGVPTHWSNVRLGVNDGCLSALCSKDLEMDDIEMWMMKDYGVAESWTKIVIFSPTACIDSLVWLSFSPMCIDSLVSPASVWKEEENE